MQRSPSARSTCASPSAPRARPDGSGRHARTPPAPLRIVVARQRGEALRHRRGEGVAGRLCLESRERLPLRRGSGRAAAPCDTLPPQPRPVPAPPARPPRPAAGAPRRACRAAQAAPSPAALRGSIASATLELRCVRRRHRRARVPRCRRRVRFAASRGGLAARSRRIRSASARRRGERLDHARACRTQHPPRPAPLAAREAPPPHCPASPLLEPSRRCPTDGRNSSKCAFGLRELAAGRVWRTPAPRVAVLVTHAARPVATAAAARPIAAARRTRSPRRAAGTRGSRRSRPRRKPCERSCRASVRSPCGVPVRIDRAGGGGRTDRGARHGVRTATARVPPQHRAAVRATGRALRTVARLLGETAQHQPLERRGDAARGSGNRWRRRRERARGGVRIERRIAREQLVGQRAERIHVVGDRGRRPVELLRAHVNGEPPRGRSSPTRAARPKSASIGAPSSPSSTLAGLRSRCTSPRACRAGEAVGDACQRAEQLRPRTPRSARQVAAIAALANTANGGLAVVTHRSARCRFGCASPLLQARPEEPRPLSDAQRSVHQHLEHAVHAGLAIARLPDLRRATLAELAQQRVPRSENLPAFESLQHGATQGSVAPAGSAGPAARPRSPRAARSRSRTAP